MLADPILITGTPGTGKTSMLLFILQQLSQQDCIVVVEQLSKWDVCSLKDEILVCYVAVLSPCTFKQYSSHAGDRCFRACQVVLSLS